MIRDMLEGIGYVRDGFKKKEVDVVAYTQDISGEAGERTSWKIKNLSFGRCR